MKFSFDIRDPKLWKSAAVSLIWIAFFALLSVFLTNVLFGVALRRVLDSIEYHGGGKQKVQLVLEGVSYLAFFVCVSVSAFLRGKRRSKRVKASKEIFLRGVFLATAILVIPAILLMNLTDPTANRTLFFLYMPFVCLTGGLGFTQLSILMTAFLAAVTQYYAYWLGMTIRRKRDEA